MIRVGRVDLEHERPLVAELDPTQRMTQKEMKRNETRMKQNITKFQSQNKCIQLKILL